MFAYLCLLNIINESKNEKSFTARRKKVRKKFTPNSKMVHDLCIIKIGGAAITVKDSLETLNEAWLDHFVEFVAKPLVKTTKVVIIHGIDSDM